MPDQSSRPVIAALTAADEPLPPGLEDLQETAELRHATDADSLGRALTDADILLVTDFRSDALARAWQRASRLQWIHATSAGVDALMIPELVASDIPVTNARGVFDSSIAEYVLGSIIMLAKDFPRSLALQRAREWRHRDTERVAGQRVLVVGAGSIGREIARLCTAVGMRVSGMARSARNNDPDFITLHAAEALHELLPAFDVVVLAAPLTPATRGMFDARAFSRMSKHARLINIGRGPLVVTDDLVAALQNEEIGAAVLDVFEEEPLPSTSPLWKLPNVIITAHMAGDFIGWREALIEQFIDNFRRWQRGEELHNLVDKRLGFVPSQRG